MIKSLLQIDPDYLVAAGVSGILLGIFFFLFFLSRRIRWIFNFFLKQKAPAPKLIASLRNLVLISLWSSVFGMILFFGFFLRAYFVFTYEKPVAEIIIHELAAKNRNQVTLIQFMAPADSQKVDLFTIAGDQWMIEGDILKWDNVLNFLGVETRYRLTRLRGRYFNTETEINETPTIYSLVSDENHPFWRYLYKYGHIIPFVNSVYGNAAYQNFGKDKNYLVYVSRTGFVVKEQKE